MRYLKDSVKRGGHEWRLIASLEEPTVFVVNGERVYEFADEQTAYSFVIEAYRKVADLRNMQVGQQYSITMADGSTKTVQVQNQTPTGVNVVDPATGEAMMIPHLQQGAEPKPVQPGQQGVGVKPQGPTGISPENVTSMRVTAAEIGREPYYCKHDQGYLYKKNPSDPEKYCAQCGMVYAASRNPQAICRKCKIPRKYCDCGRKDKKAGSEGDLCPNCGEMELGLKGCASCGYKKSAGREDDEDDGPGSYSEQKDERDWHWRDKKPEPKEKKSRREMFREWKNKERIVHAFDIKAGPAGMEHLQAMPSNDAAQEGQSMMNEKSPADFSEEPEAQPRTQDPNAKRKLTPHEIIEEAESLIRNALVKGVTIGAAELQEYMTSYYNNNPDELMKGITLAWQKVQYEESMEGGGGDPNAPNAEGMGPQGPVSPEQAAQMAPRNGPIRTPRL